MGNFLSPTPIKQGSAAAGEEFKQQNNEERADVALASDVDECDYISQLPTDLLKCQLAQFFLPYEQFKYARINTFFASLYGVKSYNFKFFSHRDKNCWFAYIHEHYIESGGWLLFKNSKFDSLSSTTRLCLMYFIIYYEQISMFQDHAMSDYDAIKFKQCMPQNVNHLRVIGSQNAHSKLTQFIQNVLYYSSSMNPINAIYIERCNLNDADVCKLSYALIQRQYTSNLRGFSIGGNPNISDQYIGLFLDVISKQCPSLRTLGLHSTNITNKACRIIFDFYASKKRQQMKKEERRAHDAIGEKQFEENEAAKSNDDRESVRDRNDGDIVLEKLYLMRNTKITEQGIDILNEIFVNKYLDDSRLEHQVVINCARCGLKTKKDSWNRTIRV